jgi:hypothetical protein
MRKHVEIGEPTYRRYLIMDIFDSDEDCISRWKKDIKEKLDSSWEIYIRDRKTEISNKDVYVRKYISTNPGTLANIEINMYRDGFHISVSTSPYSIISKMNKFVFGDVNLNQGFTKEIALVPKIANAIVKDVDEFYKNDNK